MSIIDGMIQEYQHESAQTRKVLERVPEQHFGWKPHDKSMTLCELASHLSEIPTWVRATMKQDEFVWSMEDWKPYKAESVKQMLADYDSRLVDAFDAMKGTPDSDMMKNWKMVMDGQTIVEMPRVAVLRNFVLNHAIHHRAQLGVYLRLQDVPLPQIYGPTADEQ
jgi:uncharacterized damage-inducible protein DinB